MKSKKVLLSLLFLFSITLLMPMFNKVFAVEMSDTFKRILTDGKLVINSVEPTSADDANFLIGEYVSTTYEGFWADVNTCNDDFTSCDITYDYMGENEETHTVSIVYNYDKNVKTLINNYTNKFPSNKVFMVKDMELINYWLNYQEDNEHFEDYSSELKAYINYRNFDFSVSNRAGEDSDFLTARIGIATFLHNNKIYYVNNNMGTKGEHIIYVPDGTGNTAEALMEAAQKRIDDYVGKNKAEVSIGGDITEYYTNYYTELIASATDSNEEELYQGYYDYFLSEYNNEDGTYYFLKSAEGNYYFNVEIDGVSHMIIIVKDSDSMVKPTYKTADISTSIEISSASPLIPLDTNIKATKLSSGSDYERTIKVLNVTDNETFDLKLYSGSLSDYITKLEDGTFEVRIPLDEKYKGKDLIIYYVDANNKITEYNVKVENGYAVFTTDHFSIYTLAEKPEKDVTPNTGIENNSNVFSMICIISLFGVIALKRVILEK